MHLLSWKVSFLYEKLKSTTLQCIRLLFVKSNNKLAEVLRLYQNTYGRNHQLKKS